MTGSRQCAFCGASFEAKRHNQRYCSVAHGRQAEIERRRLIATAIERSCAYCGTHFQTRHPRKRFCTPRCQAAADLSSRRTFGVTPFWPNAKFSDRIVNAPDGERAIFLADMQLPFEDPKRLAAVEAFMADWQPHRVFYLGDILDLYSWAPFADNKSNLFGIMDEIRHARNVLERHRALLPDAIFHYTLGNHEERASRVWGAKPEIREYIAAHLPEDMGLDALGIDYYEYGGHIDYLGFKVTHGMWHSRALYGALNVAKLTMSRLGGSGISGHAHKLAMLSYTDAQMTHTWYLCGHLCRSNLPWSRGTLDWQPGFALGVVYRNKVHIRLVPIYKEGFYAEGKFYPVSH